MFGDQEGLQALDQRRQPGEMAGIDAVGAAQREADAMQADRPVAAEPLQSGERRPAAHVILGMNFEKADGRR